MLTKKLIKTEENRNRCKQTANSFYSVVQKILLKFMLKKFPYLSLTFSMVQEIEMVPQYRPTKPFCLKFISTL